MALRLSDPDAAPSRGQVSRTPIDAETAGRRRLWWAMAEQRYERFERLLASREIGKLALMFTKPSGIGRKAAWLALARTFRDVATLDHLDLQGRDPVAVWVVLKPRGHALVSYPERDLTEGEKQDAVAVCYSVIARLPDGTITTTGLWSCEVTWHALGRVMQRHRRAEPDEIILRLHRSLLRLPLSALSSGPGTELLIKAGEGVFVAKPVAGYDDVELGKKVLLFRSHTWLADGMLFEGQEEAAARLAAACDDDTEATVARWFLNPVRLASSADQAAA